MKKMFAVLLVMILGVGVFAGYAEEANTEEKTSEESIIVEAEKGINLKGDVDKKALLVVSFGTSYEDTRKVTIEATEDRLAKEFPDYEVRRAFTSNIIINKLKERDGLLIDTPAEALQKLYDEGFGTVLIQPLHIINGAEYDDVIEESILFRDKFEKFGVGRPILTSHEDYSAAIEALKGEFDGLKKDEAFIFMGHGTHHDANSAYACLDYMLKIEGYENVFVGTVEGFPTLENIIPQLEKKNIKKVKLMPFMLVAGDHANNDMAGDEEDSWKMILKGEGYEVETILKGLGENEGIRDIYVEHAKALME
jgi:sirohydrochlorin cobaltochelatase